LTTKMMETVRDRTDSLGIADLNEQDKLVQRLSQLERTVNNLQTELKTNQEGTRAWRIRAFGALCIFAILPLAILTTVTLIKENSLEESEAQMAAEMASLVDKLQKRSAHCGFRNDWRQTSVITYDSLITEEGNSSLNMDTGIWTAGYSGVYQVSWSAQNQVNKHESNTIYLVRNGEQVEESRHHAYNYLSISSSCDTSSGSCSASTSYNSRTDELGGRTMLLSLKTDDTLALKMTRSRPITRILFCINLLYADENVSVSVTNRIQASRNESIPIGDENIEESSALNEE